MRFLIDEDLPRSAVNLFKLYGHEAHDVRDVGLRGAKDSVIAEFAQKGKFCLVTGDFDFSDIRNYPPQRFSGIVVLEIPKNATAKYILNLIEGFLKQKTLITELSGRLVIIETERIRIRKG